MRYSFLLLLPLAHFAAAQAPAPVHPPHTILVRGTAEQELEPETFCTPPGFRKM